MWEHVVEQFQWNSNDGMWSSQTLSGLGLNAGLERISGLGWEMVSMTALSADYGTYGFAFAFKRPGAVTQQPSQSTVDAELLVGMLFAGVVTATQPDVLIVGNGTTGRLPASELSAMGITLSEGEFASAWISAFDASDGTPILTMTDPPQDGS